MGSLRSNDDNALTTDVAAELPGYDDASVADAHYMLEALNGPNAPILARALAFERLAHGNPRDALFWLRVYVSLVTAPSSPELVHIH